MILKVDKTYSSNNSDLSMKVLRIHHISDKYIKIRGLLMHLSNIIELANYKLYHQNISHWKELSK